MAKVRVVSFASDGTPSPIHPFTLFSRMNTSNSWNSHGLSSTVHLQSTLTSTFDRVCSRPTRVLLRADDGSGLEISIERLIRIIEEETVLGKGKLTSLYLVVYETDPIPGNMLTEEDIAALREEQRVLREKEAARKCCAVQ